MDLYQEFNLLPDYNTLLSNGLIKENRKEAFAEFCSYTISNLYSIYLESQKYSKEIDNVKTQDGRRIGLLYKFVSKNFCTYFENNKPHLIKFKEIKNNNIINKKTYINGNNKNENNKE